MTKKNLAHRTIVTVVTVVTVVTIVTIVTVATVVTVVTKKKNSQKKFIHQKKILLNFLFTIFFLPKFFYPIFFSFIKKLFSLKKITKIMFSPEYFFLKNLFTLESHNLFPKKIKQPLHTKNSAISQQNNHTTSMQKHCKNHEKLHRERLICC